MTPADRVIGSRACDVNHLFAQTGTSDGPIGTLAVETERAVFQLRREAVAAVARQRRIREETLVARRLSEAVERRAAHAFDQGDEILARQILARDICTLKTQEALERELADASLRVTQLVRRLARTEDQARLAQRGKETLANGASRTL